MKKQLNKKDFKINFWAFVWHATFLALTKSFIDTDTVLPALILKSGGNEFLIGLMSAIMVGSAKFMQLFFAPYISSRKSKKIQLIIAIYTRIFAIAGLSILILSWQNIHSQTLFFVIMFVLLAIFSWSGSYGGVAYTDLLGKSIEKKQRLTLFSLKQMFQAIGFVASAIAVKYILKLFEFPVNYAYSFLIATILLVIGSLGFFMLRERYIEPKQKKSLITFIKLIPAEVRQNANLKYFIIVVNLLGIFLAFTPFLISYEKQNTTIDPSLIGNLLIIKMTGVVLGSLAVYSMKKKIKYKTLLTVTALVTVVLPIVTILAKGNLTVFKIIFFVIGIAFSFLRIAIEGIIIEITNDHNRAEYAGIIGAANLSGILFPFIIGSLLTVTSYEIVFGLTSIIAGFSIIFIRKLNCK